jgi:hypothetical protein
MKKRKYDKERYHSSEKIRKRAVYSNYNWRLKLKQTAHAALGGKCSKCGFQDSRALQIDHVNGDGYVERHKKKIMATTLLKDVINSMIQKEKKYQLLCANCNWIKRVENKEALQPKYSGEFTTRISER